MLKRPYRNEKVCQQRADDAEKLKTEQAVALEKEQEKKLKNAYPSFRCRMCGVTGAGLTKVSVGEAYFLCKLHFAQIHKLIEDYMTPPVIEDILDA